MRFPFDIPAAREFDAVGFGLNAVDHLVVVPAYPAFDTKTRLVERAQSAGGQTASAMVALARLGARAAYAGRFGSDAEGRFGLQTLRDEGVCVERAEVIEGARTQVAYVIIDARTGARTIIRDRDERLAYRADEIPSDFAARGRVLHLDAHDPPACAALAREARAAGTIVSAHIDNVYEGLPGLLPHLDLLISSSEFPRRLTGMEDERAALVEVKSRLRADALVGMTLGARGAVLYHGGRFVECPAFTVPGGCRDTTGAGDAFHAGFLHAMLGGADVETSLRTGCAVAALKCRRLGARAGLPTPRELAELPAPAPGHGAKR
ncbi:MAG: PfkB family carbohydrate kinase [Acidobacteria bacterium]|nr:PfkB family carbohydrate kinase [Acidobacteriota bacterium]MCA1642834.1 PfkB family carbohydrate kinase [Acidobacteriota bacterium]